MSPDVQEALTSFFAMIWSIFTQTQIPYMGITFAQLWVGLFASSVFIAFLHKVLDNEVGYKSGKGDYFEQGENKYE